MKKLILSLILMTICSMAQAHSVQDGDMFSCEQNNKSYSVRIQKAPVYPDFPPIRTLETDREVGALNVVPLIANISLNRVTTGYLPPVLTTKFSFVKITDDKFIFIDYQNQSHYKCGIIARRMDPPRMPDIRVDYILTGTLVHSFGIGGENSGFSLQTSSELIELIPNQELLNSNLFNKEITLRGVYTTVRGVEIPQRKVLKVLTVYTE